MTEQQIKEAIPHTETYKLFPNFKKPLVLKHKNISRFFDLFGQADRLGIDYIKQNQNVTKSDFLIIEELINIKKQNKNESKN